MIFDWLNTGEASLFAQELIRDINRLFPPVPQTGKTIQKKAHQKKFGGLIVRARAFSAQHKLNIYKKAKLLNMIKWGMKDAGHEDALIDEIVSLMAQLLNK